MDQAAGSPSPAVNGEPKGGEQRSAEEIRRDIERTRAQLGETVAETVAAVSQKADVKAQAQAKVSDVRQGAQARKDQLLAKARGATPESAAAGAQHVAGTAKRNPVPLAVAGALAAGVLIGWMIGRR